MSAAVEMPPIVSERGNLPLFLVESAEFALLLACCAAPSGSHDNERVLRIVRQPIDWERLLKLVDQHRVVPQVYGQLSTIADLVPGRIQRGLRERYQHNARKALWFTGELVRVVSHLESRGMTILPC